VVVVGAGLAGAQCVGALRRGGLQGRITLLGDEPHAPYDRPPLSKDVLLGKADSTTLDVDYRRLGVELLTGRRATGLEPGVLHTDAGPLPYGSLVIATGAAPTALPGADGAHLLRTLDDALALRARLRPGSRIVLVGAGWIGAETATAARELGCEVTVVEAGPAPLPGALPRSVGGAMTAWYEEAGVALHCGARVAAVGPGEVLLGDGTRLAADEVVVGIGARPATGWLTARPARAPGWPSSTGTTRCSPATRWPRPCSGRTPRTTRCRTSGRSSSGGWCSTPGGTPRATSCSGAGRPATRPGRCSGCAAARCAPC
jgi:NADPH-dependent 2,4-dienoyl-CoA reductase/sulfur reductase-like enzyme